MDTLLMDNVLLRSAIVNLIDNAKKASEAGGVIELSAQDNIITVRDHGKGIPREEVAKITEPFYMIDKSRNRHEHGSGLGLALVAAVAQAHGATLSLESELGAGTTVRMVFPQGMITK